MIAQDRMARHTTYCIPVFVGWQFLSCQTDPLEDTDVVSDHTGLPDNGSRPVVDREIVSDLRTRMDIDTSLLNGPFSNHAGNKGDAQPGIAGAQCDSCRQPGNRDNKK